MSGRRHPDTAAISGLQAGLTSGFRARRLAAHVARCARCAAVSDQLSAMSSALASVPVPDMPQAFARQISAAIATEAAARASAADLSPAGADASGGAGATVDAWSGVGTDESHRDHDSAEPARRRPRPERSRQPRGFRFRPAMALAPAVVIVLAGFGYLVSNLGASSGPSFSQADSEPALSPASASAAEPAAGRAPGVEPAHTRALPFMVIESGTHYAAATLRTQVRAELNAENYNAALPVPSASVRAPSASSVPSSGVNSAASSAGASFDPGQPLIGCVLTVTGGAKPSLVERAFYQGKSAYVIAVPSKVWVVGLGCTASNPKLITSVPLTGTP